MNRPAATVTVEQPTGLEDVTRSVRALARSTRNLSEQTARVVERELAMAIRIAAQVRDDVVSARTLEEARSMELSARLREDAHQLVDIFLDIASVSALTTLRFFERLTDEPRPALAARNEGSSLAAGPGPQTKKR